MLDFTTTSYYQKWIREDWLLYFKLLVAVNIIHIGLLLLGLKRVQRILGRRSYGSKINCEIPDEESMILFSHHVRRISRSIKNNRFILSNCLSTSLLFWYVLMNQGLETNLIIGTNLNRGVFKAHAWIELQNHPLTAGILVNKKYSRFAHNFA